MSRIDGRLVSADCDENGLPQRLVLPDGFSLSVIAIRDYWREWFDPIGGEPERDVWQLDTDAGHLELHGLRDSLDAATVRQWLLYRWED